MYGTKTSRQEWKLSLGLKKSTEAHPGGEANQLAPQVTPSAANSGCEGRRAPQMHLSRGKGAALFLPQQFSLVEIFLRN